MVALRKIHQSMHTILFLQIDDLKSKLYYSKTGG